MVNKLVLHNQFRMCQNYVLPHLQHQGMLKKHQKVTVVDNDAQNGDIIKPN